jgi:hypothetical protein
VCSDGPDPKSQIGQILAVVPILPGSSPISKYSIPAHVEGHEHPPATKNVEKRETPADHPPPAQHTEDLIDFGESGTSAVPSAPTASALPSRPPQPTFKELQQPLQPTASTSSPQLRRLDTETNDLDEFFDAKG